MKTKAVNKEQKKKKRSLRETSLLSKSSQEIENTVHAKRNIKKVKIDNTVQNGNPKTENKAQVFTKIDESKKKRNKKETPQKYENADEPSKREVKINTAECNEMTLIKIKKKKLEHLKKKQLDRQFHKIMEKERKHNVTFITPNRIEQLKSKLAEIRSREVLSKTAKKKLAALQRKLQAEESANKTDKLDATEKGKSKEDLQAVSTLVKNKRKAEKNETGRKKKNGKNKEIKDRLREGKQDDDITEGNNDRDQSDLKEEEKFMNFLKKQVDNESDEAEEDRKDTDEEINITEVKREKKEVSQSDKFSGSQKKRETTKKRYVLFVGNLPFDVTIDEVKQHFFTKVDTVTSVRIPTKPGTKTQRGFAYVEVSNAIDYEKGLSLHHTFLKKRRINVQYTAPDSQGRKRADVIAKNKKLGALRKAGKLAGHQRNKTSFKKKK